MTTFAAIREGLAANLRHLNDTKNWIQVSAYVLASPTPPMIQVMPSEIHYDLVLARGGDEVVFTIQAFVVENFDQAAQMNLDQLLADSGPLSVKAIIEADRTLGGIIDDLIVTNSTGYQIYSLAGRGPILGADWSVQLTTSNA